MQGVAVIPRYLNLSNFYLQPLSHEIEQYEFLKTFKLTRLLLNTLL